MLEAIYIKGGVFKCPKVFQYGNGSEFKCDVTKLLDKHNVEHTHTAFVEAFNKDLAELFFKPMDAQELKDPEKVSTNWVKNLNSIIIKMNNTNHSGVKIRID